MVLLYIIIYLIGSILAYGIATWIKYKSEITTSRNIRPDYVKSYHNPLAIISVVFSWLAVITLSITAKDFYGKINIKYNHLILLKDFH